MIIKFLPGKILPQGFKFAYRPGNDSVFQPGTIKRPKILCGCGCGEMFTTYPGKDSRFLTTQHQMKFREMQKKWRET